MSFWLTGSGWGTREAAIPGEWALLVLILLGVALLGLSVLWFTLRKREAMVRGRARRRDQRKAQYRDRREEDAEHEPQPGSGPESTNPEPATAPEPTLIPELTLTLEPTQTPASTDAESETSAEPASA